MSAPETILRAWRVGARKLAKPDLGTMNEIFVVDTDEGRLVFVAIAAETGLRSSSSTMSCRSRAAVVTQVPL